MADLTEVQSSQSVKLAGANPPTGAEDNYAEVDSSGNLAVKSTAAGAVTPGTVATNSALAGGQYNSSNPTLTTGQQAALQLNSSGALKVDGSATTQPVSAAFLPLPTGAATSALQTTINTTLGSPFQAGGSIGNTTFASTQSGTWNINNISGTISLPTGASTSALQTTGNSSLSSIDTKTPSLGQALAAASIPVVLTAAQITTLTPLSTVAVTQSTSPWEVSASSLPLPTGAATEVTLAKLPVAQASATSGQSGTLVQGAVTTAAPTYTTGQTDPLSLTTSGALRVDGSAVTQPVSAASLPLPSGAATSANQTLEITALSTIDTDIKASQPRKLQDGVGNNLTSTLNNSKRALDVKIVDQINTSDIFGASITAIRKTQFTGSFQFPIATQNVTQTTSGTGTITQPSESAVISTGIGTTSSAKIVSNQIVSYQPGKEIYSEFTAAFTAPTSGASYQRIGLYDGSNGFFIGYSGTSFGITVRNNGSDIFTAQASFNGDTLTGTVGSSFTRSGTAESINQTFKNVFRIRFGWFGSAQIMFEILSPDGGWVTFHTIKQPNTTSTSSILSPTLPMTAETSKTASDTTNLQITMTCWDVGTSAVQGMDISGVGSILAASGSITVNCANGYNTVNFSLSGTWSGTLIARGSMGDGQFYTINFYNTSGNSVTSTSSNSLLSVPTNGYTIVQLYASSWTSGTVVASWNCSTAIVAPSGTVSVSPLPATGSGFSFGQVNTNSSSAYLAVQSTAYTEPTTNSTMTIVSSSASDSSAGTGARTITVTYLDQTGSGPFTTSFTLNGTTPVAAGVSNMCFIEKIIVSTVGSTGSNVGILTLKTGGAVTVGTVAATSNQTFWAQHYVPASKTSYISGFSFGNNATASGNGAQFILKAATPTIANTPEIQISDVLGQAGVSTSSTRGYLSTIQVVGPARIRAYVLPYANAATTQFASFDYIDN